LLEKLDGEELKKVNIHLARTMRKRAKESSNNTIKIHRDKEFSENPMERVDMEETVTVEEDGIKDLEAVYSYCREKCAVDLQVVRIPIVEDRMPPDYRSSSSSFFRRLSVFSSLCSLNLFSPFLFILFVYLFLPHQL